MSDVKPWKELSRKQIFKKFSRKIDEVLFQLPDGSKADFYIKAEGYASSILGLTSDNRVILVRQYRPGPKKILDEIPGGFVDPDENPEGTALREFVEETGYDGDIKFVGTCIDDAYSTMERYCYVATNCRQIGKPQNTATEQTVVVLLSVDEFRQRLRAGQLTDVEMGYMGLDYLKLL